MSLIDATCKVCGSSFKLDAGEKSLDEVIKVLRARESFECPGHHFEIGSPMDFWTLGKIHEGHAPTEEDWHADMIKRHGTLYNTDELSEMFEVTGFLSGMCMAKVRETGKEVVLNYSSSPKGVRYYYGYEAK